MHLKVLGIVLAGGKGSRLMPLTGERAKPAVSFGGKYRIVDFVLSNLVNSGIYSIYVLTQFKSQSLLQHLSDGWQFSGMLRNQFIIPVPAQMRLPGETWYRGTADAIHQNGNLIEQAHPDLVLIFGADHIYRMNIREMIEYHETKRAHVTVAAIPVERKYAADFGVVETTATGRITAFHEKKPDAPGMPGDPERVLASMGNYVFSTDMLLKMVEEDAQDETSAHDFGTNILPKMVDQVDMFAYDFQTNRVPGESSNTPAYWRDVGTIDAYYEASMDIRSVSPQLNLYNREWPLRTASYADPPAKFVHDEDGNRGQAVNSVVCGGSIIAGARVSNSVLGRNVVVQSGSAIEDAVIFDNCLIGSGCRIRRTILDKNVRIPDDTVIGYDAARDRERYHVTDSGIVVVPGKRSPVELTGIDI